MNSKQAAARRRAETEQYNKKVGKMIKKGRMRQKMTAVQLADKVGVSQSSVSAWENGRRGLDPLLLEKVCDVLHIDSNPFADDDEEENKEEKEDEIEVTKIYSENKVYSIEEADKMKVQIAREYLTLFEDQIYAIYIDSNEIKSSLLKDSIAFASPAAGNYDNMLINYLYKDNEKIGRLTETKLSYVFETDNNVDAIKKDDENLKILGSIFAYVSDPNKLP